MKTLLARLLLCAALTGASLASVVWHPEPAHAVAILELSAGPDTVTIEDNGPGDMLGELGRIAYFGSVHNFIVNLTVGTTKPFRGAVNDPQVGLFSVNVSYGTGALTIKLTDTDFMGLVGDALDSSITGSTDGTVRYRTYLDSTNTLFGEETLLADLGPFNSGLGSFSESSSYAANMLSLSGPYSVTLVAKLTHPGGGLKLTHFTSSLTDPPAAVPEPSGVMLLGSGLAGLVGWRWRKTRAATS